MTAARAWISYGQGGAAIEVWSTGERALIKRCQAKGIDTRGSPYEWHDVPSIVRDILATPTPTKIIVGGDSLGANEATEIARQVGLKDRRIDLLFGFQRSVFGVQVPVPPCVVIAYAIYNPLGAAGGDFFGSDPWSENGVTRVYNIPIIAAHPDDWGQAQDLVFAQILKIVS